MRVLAIEQLGKYELVRKIGEGGFGTVWLGRDPVLKRTVAIKTCESEDENLRRRFLREAEIAAALVHPNIVVVHDFGYEKEIPYLVQEFLSGEDLSKIIARREPVALATRLRWLADVCRGLQHAHTHGVVHRDVKPSNVRILDDGSAKVLDFGIAKLAEADTLHLTRTGSAIGTVGYMAPEQLSGQPVDYRADIFSFGVLAFELLCYRRPFDGETVSRVLYQVLNEDPPPLTALAQDVPAALEAIVLRCLAKLPAQRYGSFRTVLDDLERVAAGAVPDLEATGEVTAGIRRDRTSQAEAPAVAAAATPEERPAFEPTVRMAERVRRAPRTAIVVAGVVAAATAVIYFVLPLRESVPEEAVEVPTPAVEAAKPAVVPAPSPPVKPSRSAAKQVPKPAAVLEPILAPTPAEEAPTGELEEVPTLAQDALITEPGPGVVLPRIVERPPMTYPPRARAERLEGVVSLAVLVDEKGNPVEIRELGPPVGLDLDEATVEYARHCRWAPGTRDGVATPMWFELRVRYAADPKRR